MARLISAINLFQKVLPAAGRLPKTQPGSRKIRIENFDCK
jgi:hypothetical protein